MFCVCGASLPERLVRGAERVVHRLHEDAAEKVQHGDLDAAGQRVNPDARAGGERREVLRPQQARLALDERHDLLALPDVVAHRHHVHAGGEDLAGVGDGQAGAAGGVLDVGDAEIHLALLAERGEFPGEDVAAGAADHVADEQRAQRHFLLLSGRRRGAGAAASRARRSASTAGETMPSTRPPPRGDLLDEPRVDEGVLRLRRDEDRLDSGAAAVGERHLDFVLQVRDGPDASQDHGDFLGLREVHHEAAERLDLDVLEMGDLAPHHRQALLEREDAGLLGVVADADEQAVEDAAGALDHVQMPDRRRVESAWIQCGAHGWPPDLEL